MEFTVTLNRAKLVEMMGLMAPQSYVTLKSDGSFIAYNNAPVAASPQASAQPVDSDAAKLRCEIANLLGMEYKNDAHLLSVLGNAITSPGGDGTDQTGIEDIFQVLNVPFGQFNNALAEIRALFGNDIVDAVEKLRKNNATMSQQIVDLQRTLRDLRAGVKDALGTFVTSDENLIDACTCMRNDRHAAHMDVKVFYESVCKAMGLISPSKADLIYACAQACNDRDAAQRRVAEFRSELGNFRCSVAESIGTTYNGDKALLGACAALRDERKSCVGQLCIERENHAQLKEELALMRDDVLDNASRILQMLTLLGIDHAKEWPDRLQEIRVISRSGATAKQSSADLAEYERGMENICAELGVNSESNINYIISTITNLKRHSRPPEAQQLTYRVHDEEPGWWRVSTEFSSTSIPKDQPDALRCYIFILQKSGYKERK